MVFILSFTQYNLLSKGAIKLDWLFRVWTPSTKTLVDNVNEINLGNNVVANIEDGKLVVQFIKEEESNIKWITTQPQFYSGMNDMNSKKIFANDIIEVNDKFLRGKRLKVIFDNGCVSRGQISFISTLSLGDHDSI